MMTVFEFQARVIERAALALAFWVRDLPADKVNWKPAMEGSSATRSTLEQVQECVSINRMCTAQLRGIVPAPPAEGGDASEPTCEEALRQLAESAQELATTVRGMDEEAFNREYTLPFAKLQGAVLLDLVAMNMSYHGGQVNLIQMLYGDDKFHVPPDFTKF